MKNPYLRDAVNEADAAERAKLVARARENRAKIEQIFIDCASWNDNARKPHESPIDPDPDGTLRRMADKLDDFLSYESGGVR